MASDNPSVTENIDDEALYVNMRVDHERKKATELKRELENLWKNDTAAMYELTSVFIHRGSSPSFGHYFFYSRNLPANPDQWFKYNDSTVTIVSKDEVFADTTGSTANPYMVRDISFVFCDQRLTSCDPIACVRSQRRRGHRNSP